LKKEIKNKLKNDVSRDDDEFYFEKEFKYKKKRDYNGVKNSENENELLRGLSLIEN
jgi:hypothetical protein